MIAPNKKRITISLNDLSVTMIQKFSKDSKMTKSQIVELLIKPYVLEYWITPKEIQKNKEGKK